MPVASLRGAPFFLKNNIHSHICLNIFNQNSDHAFEKITTQESWRRSTTHHISSRKHKVEVWLHINQPGLEGVFQNGQNISDPNNLIICKIFVIILDQMSYHK